MSEFDLQTNLFFAVLWLLLVAPLAISTLAWIGDMLMDYLRDGKPESMLLAQWASMLREILGYDCHPSHEIDEAWGFSWGIAFLGSIVTVGVAFLFAQAGWQMPLFEGLLLSGIIYGLLRLSRFAYRMKRFAGKVGALAHKHSRSGSVKPSKVDEPEL